MCGKPKRFHSTVSYEGGAHIPDGSCLDSQGCIWNAHWDGKCAELLKEGANGTAQVLKRIEFPVSNVTCVCLGGEEMNLLFATTASLNTEGEALAGDLFVCRVETEGLPESRFKDSQ